MWTLPSAVCVICVLSVGGAFHGSCPRKEPPHGALVAFVGSDMVLTCSGHVIVDGVKVVSKSRLSDAAVTHSTVNAITHNTVLQRHTAVNTNSEGHPASTFSPTHARLPLQTKSEGDSGQMEFEDEYEEEEDSGTAVKLRSQWQWNGKNLQGNTQGPRLFLSRVRMSDSGRYSCFHDSTERFTTRLIVAEAPETPHLSCYKKSPSSKIRCEWTPQKQVHKGTSCSLLIRKSLMEPFIRVSCSYSTRRSRCWCALDHDEEEKRTLYQAFLCVTSVTGNTTSDQISFTPMSILKPDPPYNMSIQPETGLNRTLTVTWKPPYTWKLQDRFYELIYEIRYKPVKSAHFQIKTMSCYTNRHTITDAQAGLEYEVQARAKDEYEGTWSEWSPPKYGSSWTNAPRKYMRPAEQTTPDAPDSSSEDLFATPFTYFSEGSGSGSEDLSEEFSSSIPQQQGIFYLYLWISVIVCFSLAILAVYIMRYRDKCLSKLQSLGVLAPCGDSVHPLPAPVAQGHALLNKDQPLNEVKDNNEEELRNEERIEAINFNNSSYFLVQMES